GFGIYTDDDGGLMTMTTHAYRRSLVENPELSAEILISRAFRRMICFGAKPKALTAFLYHIDIANADGQNIAAGVKRGISTCAAKVSKEKCYFNRDT
ncbi:MAG: hypothetical protein ACK5L5_10235, partial [Bacteroidales bacterium]